MKTITFEQYVEMQKPYMSHRLLCPSMTKERRAMLRDEALQKMKENEARILREESEER